MPDPAPFSESPSWPHAPAHRVSEPGPYFVTAGTYGKRHHFSGPDRLRALHDGLHKYARRYAWTLEAWAIFPNHYHFVARSPSRPSGGNTHHSDEASLRRFLRHFHSRSAKWINQLDATPNRKIWHNYWDTRLTFGPSYYARLHYVHSNPVHHSLVKDARQYPWCSASWFQANATKSQQRTVYSFKIDQLQISDDY